MALPTACTKCLRSVHDHPIILHRTGPIGGDPMWVCNQCLGLKRAHNQDQAVILAIDPEANFDGSDNT